MSHVFISHSTRDKVQALRVLDFLASCGYRTLFLDSDPECGIQAGADWEKALYRNLSSAGAVVVLCSDHMLASKWCFVEVAQARALGKPIFPVIVSPCEVLELLKDRQAVDLASEGELALKRLLDGLRSAGLDPNDSLIWDPRRPPYPGLNFFDEADAGVFFGRDDEIRKVLEALTRMQRRDTPRMVVVVGASGSGKSSLVRAGVLPRLGKDPSRWAIVPPFRPRSEPIAELAKSLARAFPDGPSRPDWKAVRDRLRAAAQTDNPPSPDALAELATDLALIRDRREANVLLTIDQAEEALQAGDGPSAGFLRLIRRAVEAPGSPLFALLTLRSDCLGTFQNHPAHDDLAFADVPLGPMALAHFPQVIEGPARRSGIELADPRLVAAMVADTRTHDALPLLAFTLRAMYDRTTDSRRFTHALYRDDLGGIQGAVAVVFRQIKDEVKLVAGSEAEADLRRAFLKLVRLDADGNYARKPTPWDALPVSARPILEKLISARLLASEGDGPRRIVEVVHESLFRNWDDLARWLAEKRELLLWRQNLQDELRSWTASGAAPGYLLSGGRVAEARRMLAADGDEFEPHEVRFLEASVAQEDRKAEERRRLFRRVRIAAFVAGVFAVLATVGGGVALNQRNLAKSQAGRIAEQSRKLARQNRDLDAALAKVEGERDRANRAAREARREASRAHAVRLSAEAQQVMGAKPQLALLLAFESVRALHLDEFPDLAFHPVTDAFNKVFNNLSGQGLCDYSDTVALVAYAPDSKSLTCVSRSGEVRVWDTAANHRGTPRQSLRMPMRPSCVALAPGGKRLALCFADRSVYCLDLAAPDPIATRVLLKVEGTAHDLAFSTDGRSLAAGTYESPVRVWDLTATDPDASGRALPGHTGRINRVAFSPDGKTLASASDDQTVRVWDLTADDPGAHPRVLRSTDKVRPIAFSPDGKTLASASVSEVNKENAVRVWDLASTNPDIRPRVLSGHTLRVEQLAFSPDGKTLASASDDRTVRAWDLTSTDPGARARVLTADGQLKDVAFSQRGKTVVAACVSGAVWSWNLTPSDPDPRPLVMKGHDGPTFCVAFAPDDRSLAAGGFDGTVRIWDPAAPFAESNPRPLLNLVGPVDAFAISPDRRLFAFAVGGDPRIDVADLNTPESGVRTRTLGKHDGSILSLSFSSDGKALASGSNDGSVRIWDLTRPEPGDARHVLGGHKFGARIARFSPDGRWLASGSIEGKTLVWDLTATVPSAGHRVIASDKSGYPVVAFAPSGERMALSSMDGTMRVLDLTAEEMVSKPRVLSRHGQIVGQLVFSRDGRSLAGAAGNGEIRFWDLTDREPSSGSRILVEGNTRGHSGSESLDFSPDGSRLAATMNLGDFAVRVWDITARGPAARPIVLRGESRASKLTFSPDGRSLACAFEAFGAIRIWDLTAQDPGLSVRVLLGDGNLARDLAFAPDGRRLTSILHALNNGRSVHRWDLDPRDVMKRSRQKLGRNLTLVEWQQYFDGKPYRPTFPDLPFPPYNQKYLHICRNLGRDEWEEHFSGVPYCKTFPDLPIPSEATSAAGGGTRSVGPRIGPE